MLQRNTLIPVGEEAPDFTAQASDGRTVALSELRGHRGVVLIFYPGDFTPVCTAQLCRAAAIWPRFDADDVAMFGINPMSRWIHEQFAAVARLPFQLLHDEGGAICAAYGCRSVIGTARRTVYGIDKEGRVAFAERGMPDIDRVLAALGPRVFEP